MARADFHEDVLSNLNMSNGSIPCILTCVFSQTFINVLLLKTCYVYFQDMTLKGRQDTQCSINLCTLYKQHEALR